MDFLETAAGLVLLLVAGDMLVRGAVSAGLRYGIPAILIGLTIVAFGTSAPELFITIEASMEGAPGIAIGNVVGSNIANVLLVLGMPALFAPLGDSSPETRRHYLIMLAVTLVAVALCFIGTLTWWQGALLLTLLALFLLDSYRSAMAARAAGESGAPEEVDEADAEMPTWKIAALMGAGVIGLPLGAALAIDGARGVAETFGFSDEEIGLTLIALGTSLPELATTIMAAVRARADVAIGNVIGSNVFNLLCILGVAATLDDIAIPPEFFEMNFWVMMASAAALAPFIFLRRKVGRVEGGFFVAAYVAYIAFVLSPSSASQAQEAVGPIWDGGIAQHGAR